MIESSYWKADILKHRKKLKQVGKPKRWSEKLQVNFEKEIIITFFMIRKLLESHKLSSKSKKYKASIYRAPIKIDKVHNLNYWDIDSAYDLVNEEKCKKSINFICNQFIHGGAIYAYRGKNRKWEGIYTCSDFERGKYIYKIPLEEIRNIFKIVGNDYPTKMSYIFSEEKGDYIVTTN